MKLAMGGTVNICCQRAGRETQALYLGLDRVDAHWKAFPALSGICKGLQFVSWLCACGNAGLALRPTFVCQQVPPIEVTISIAIGIASVAIAVKVAIEIATVATAVQVAIEAALVEVAVQVTCSRTRC